MASAAFFEVCVGPVASSSHSPFLAIECSDQTQPGACCNGHSYFRRGPRACASRTQQLIHKDTLQDKRKRDEVAHTEKRRATLPAFATPSVLNRLFFSSSTSLSWNPLTLNEQEAESKPSKPRTIPDLSECLSKDPNLPYIAAIHHSMAEFQLN